MSFHEAACHLLLSLHYFDSSFNLVRESGLTMMAMKRLETHNQRKKVVIENKKVNLCNFDPE